MTCTDEELHWMSVVLPHGATLEKGRLKKNCLINVSFNLPTVLDAKINISFIVNKLVNAFLFASTMAKTPIKLS
jgi:hypothetical protein